MWQKVKVINVAILIIKNAYLRLPIIEQVYNNNQFSIEDLL